MIDGNVSKRTKLMDDYCSKVIEDLNQSTLILADSFQVQLTQFLATPPHLFTPSFHFLALESWKHAKSVPIFIDLAATDTPTERCVEKELAKHGLDSFTIEQAKKERWFVLLVSGFEHCGIHTNFYVWNAMCFTSPLEAGTLADGLEFFGIRFQPSSNFVVVVDSENGSCNSWQLFHVFRWKFPLMVSWYLRGKEVANRPSNETGMMLLLLFFFFAIAADSRKVRVVGSFARGKGSAPREPLRHTRGSNQGEQR
jgi:hypothetical protein